MIEKRYIKCKKIKKNLKKLVKPIDCMAYAMYNYKCSKEVIQMRRTEKNKQPSLLQKIEWITGIVKNIVITLESIFK